MGTDGIQAILEKDDWLRRMARRLFQGPARAEDAAQDAWVADLSQTAPVTEPRSWLGAALHNRRREQTRVDGRLEVSFSPPKDTFISLSVALEGHVSGGKKWNRMEAGADEDVGTIHLSQAGGVKGRLVDQAGQPIFGKPHRLQLIAPGAVPGLAVGYGASYVIDPKTGPFGLAGVPPGKALLNDYAGDAGWVTVALVEVVPAETSEVDIVYSEEDVQKARKSKPKRLDISGLPELRATSPDRMKEGALAGRKPRR